MVSKRFGVKQTGQDIVEWFFTTTKENAGFFGTIGSKYHLTWLEENDEISVHVTDQETGEHRPLGRISKNIDEADADLIIINSMKPQYISEERYSEKVLCFTETLIEYSDVPRDITEKEHRKGKKIIQYFDEESLVNYNLEQLKDSVGLSEFFEIGTMQDILEGKFQFGLTQDYMGVILDEGELLELDVLYFISGLLDYVEGHPLSEFLAKLGIFEILKEVKKIHLGETQ